MSAGVVIIGIVSVLEHSMPRPDVTGSAPEPIWPPALLVPERPPALVYLDLNHWINLSKAAVGHRDAAAYVSLLGACRAARDRGAALFPLALTHYVELIGIADPRQRQHVAGVMEELSGFKTLLSRPNVMRLELEAAIDALAGVGGHRRRPTPLIGRGIFHAYGRSGGLRLRDKDTGNDLTQQIRGAVGPSRFDALMSGAELMMERVLLAGPADADLPAVTAHGYDRDATLAVAEKRLKQELELAARLDAILEGETSDGEAGSTPSDRPRPVNWRRGRIRDIVGAREICIEMLPALIEQIHTRGISIADLVSEDQSTIRRFARSMPGSEIAIEIKTRYHRNSAHPWTVNDIHDIDALALAVPYCDVVFTDKAVRSVLVSARLDVRMGTKLPRTVTDLVGILDGLTPKTSIER